MYPFERFNGDAKRTLTLAQEEAERSHHSYIGTEHLLLGLLRVESGTAFRVLTNLGIAIEPVRETISKVLGRNERIIIQQIIPTSRVKRVIEISFEEARLMGDNEVDTGHMLMGLVIEAEGIAAHVLEDLGATHDRVIESVQGELGAPTIPRPRRPTVTAPTWLIGRPSHIKTSVGELARLLRRPSIVKLLKANGLDVAALSSQLASPPSKVVDLRNTMDAVQRRLSAAVDAQDLDRVAALGHEVDRVLAMLLKAEEEWLDSLA